MEMQKVQDELRKVLAMCKDFLCIYTEDSTLRISRDRFKEILSELHVQTVTGHGPDCKCKLLMLLKLFPVGVRAQGYALDLTAKEVLFIDREVDTEFKALTIGIVAGLFPPDALGFRLISLEELAIRGMRPFHMVVLLKEKIESILNDTTEGSESDWINKATQPHADA